MIPVPHIRRKKRTAFVVIHGIGEQFPFETLDAFTGNFIRFLGKVQLAHAITTRSDASGRSWQENFIQDEHEHGSPIDFHEFYWAYITEGKITITETVGWVEKTLAATKNYYKENEALQKKV